MFDECLGRLASFFKPLVLGCCVIEWYCRWRLFALFHKWTSCGTWRQGGALTNSPTPWSVSHELRLLPFIEMVAQKFFFFLPTTFNRDTRVFLAKRLLLWNCFLHISWTLHLERNWSRTTGEAEREPPGAGVGLQRAYYSTEFLASSFWGGRCQHSVM